MVSPPTFPLSTCNGRCAPYARANRRAGALAARPYLSLTTFNVQRSTFNTVSVPQNPVR